MIDANFYNNISLKINFLRHRQFTNAMSVNTHLEHSHNLIYVYQGKGIFQIDDKEYIIPANSIVYYPPKHYQKISTLHNQSLYYHTAKFKAATISDDDSENGLKIFDESFNLPFYHTYTDEHTANELLKKFAKLSRIYSLNQTSFTKHYYEAFFLVDILQYIDSKQANSYMSPNQRLIIDATVGYIDSHYNEKISLESLTELTNVSSTYLNKIFKQYTGRTPIDYLINIRILKAKEHLENGFSVSQTAFLSGFSDIYYFSNIFKKIEGITPSEYIHIFHGSKNS